MICLYSYLTSSHDKEDLESFISQISIIRALTFSTGFISLFFLYLSYVQLIELGLENKVSNEDIRNRWNGHIKNKDAAQLYGQDSSWTAKAYHLLYGKQSESKLHKYAKLMEFYQKIMQLEE